MKNIKAVFILSFVSVMIFLISGCASPGKPGLQTAKPLTNTSLSATATTASTPTASATPTAISRPVTPFSPEEAKRLALEFASQKTGIPVEKLKIWSQQSGIFDNLTMEKIEAYSIADEQGHSSIGVVIDPSSGKAMSFFDYQTMVGNRYKEVAGNINPGLYQNLKDKEDNYLIKVKVFPKSAASQAAAYIEAQGFPTLTVNLVTGGGIIYSELPKNFILELAKRDDVNDIELDGPYTVP